MANPEGRGGFQNRKQDINKKGAPRNQKKLRDLIIAMAAQDHDGSGRTNIIAMLEDMMLNGDSRDRQNVLRYGFGEVPKELNVQGKQKITVRVVYDKPKPANPSADAAPEASPIHREQGEAEGDRGGQARGQDDSGLDIVG